MKLSVWHRRDWIAFRRTCRVRRSSQSFKRLYCKLMKRSKYTKRPCWKRSLYSMQTRTPRNLYLMNSGLEGPTGIIMGQNSSFPPIGTRIPRNCLRVGGKLSYKNLKSFLKSMKCRYSIKPVKLLRSLKNGWRGWGLMLSNTELSRNNSIKQRIINHNTIHRNKNSLCTRWERKLV